MCNSFIFLFSFDLVCHHLLSFIIPKSRLYLLYLLSFCFILIVLKQEIFIVLTILEIDLTVAICLSSVFIVFIDFSLFFHSCNNDWNVFTIIILLLL